MIKHIMSGQATDKVSESDGLHSVVGLYCTNPGRSIEPAAQHNTERCFLLVIIFVGGILCSGFPHAIADIVGTDQD